MPGESGRRAVTNATFVAVTGATLTATREVEVETPPICARLKLYWQNPSAPLAIDIDIVAAVASLIASGLVQAARALPRLRSENAPAKISFLNICGPYRRYMELQVCEKSRELEQPPPPPLPDRPSVTPWRS